MVSVQSFSKRNIARRIPYTKYNDAVRITRILRPDSVVKCRARAIYITYSMTFGHCVYILVNTIAADVYNVPYTDEFPKDSFFTVFKPTTTMLITITLTYTTSARVTRKKKRKEERKKRDRTNRWMLRVRSDGMRAGYYYFLLIIPPDY